MDAVKPEEVKVSDMTAAELEKFVRRIIREELKAVYEYIFEIEQQMPDPDAGKEFKTEFMAGLEERRKVPISQRQGTPAEEVHRRLGLDE